MTAPKSPAEPLIDVMIRNVPRSLRRAYKSWCDLHGVSMRDMFVAHMKETIKKPAPQEMK